MQNDPLSHRRRDQLFRTCFSNPLERFRQARSAKSKCCDQCFFCGWKGRVTVYRVSEKPNGVTQIDLKEIASREVWHFSFVKSVSALLHDQTRYQGRKHFCLWCLSSFTTKGILCTCKGLTSRPTQTEVPTLMQLPTNTDLEAFIEAIKSSKGNPQKRYTEKTSQVKCNGKATKTKLFPWEKRLERVAEGAFAGRGQDQRRIEKRCSNKNRAKGLGRLHISLFRRYRK